MDDYKRQLYMRAQQLALKGRTSFVCNALKTALEEEGLGVKCGNPLELFPEFMGMYDGKCWSKRAVCSKVLPENNWWDEDWKEPRLRALDCILRN